MRGGWIWTVGSSALVAAVVLGGCLERKAARLGPNLGFGQSVQVQGDGVSAVDVLFVIDNSGSMEEEQDNLAVQIPTLVRDLAEPPDRDGDGSPDWNPAEYLRIAITTTDVGVGGTSLPTCDEVGDDGALIGGVFEWETGDDPDAFAGQVRSVVAGLGITGCALEQPLEAAARAVARGTEQAVPFPADEHLFALVLVTDEEDCSVANDQEFFSTASGSDLNVYCNRNADQLTPVADLLGQIRGARDENSFIFATIAGLPVDVAATATPEEILALPDMQYTETTDPMAGLIPTPVCEFRLPDGSSLGSAGPARRLVETGRLVPEAVLTTICTDDFGPAIAEIAARIGARVPGVCLVRELPLVGESEVPCAAQVTLTEGLVCDGRPGYTEAGTSEDGRAICDIAQVSDEQPSGFYYDPSRDGCPQLVLTDDAVPPLGSSLSVECFVQVLLADGEQCARASQCESGYCDEIARACAPLPGGAEG